MLLESPQNYAREKEPLYSIEELLGEAPEFLGQSNSFEVISAAERLLSRPDFDIDTLPALLQSETRQSLVDPHSVYNLVRAKPHYFIDREDLVRRLLKAGIGYYITQLEAADTDNNPMLQAEISAATFFKTKLNATIALPKR